MLAEHDVLGGIVDHIDCRNSIRELQRGFYRVVQAAPDALLENETVDDDLDIVLVITIEPDLLGQVTCLAVDSGACKSSPGKLLERLGELAFATLDDRSQDLKAGSLGQVENLVDYLLGGLTSDGSSTKMTVWSPDPGEQKPQVVVDLGDRSHRRSWVLGGRLLVDRDRRTEALDEIDVGLVHLAQELPRIRAQRLDIAPLALGVDSVEGEGRLSGARNPAKDDQRVAGQLQVDVSEIVLSGPPNDEVPALRRR